MDVKLGKVIYNAGGFADAKLFRVCLRSHANISNCCGPNAVAFLINQLCFRDIEKTALLQKVRAKCTGKMMFIGEIFELIREFRSGLPCNLFFMCDQIKKKEMVPMLFTEKCDPRKPTLVLYLRSMHYVICEGTPRGCAKPCDPTNDNLISAIEASIQTYNEDQAYQTQCSIAMAQSLLGNQKVGEWEKIQKLQRQFDQLALDNMDAQKLQKLQKQFDQEVLDAREAQRLQNQFDQEALDAREAQRLQKRIDQLALDAREAQRLQKQFDQEVSDEREAQRLQKQFDQERT